MTIEYNASDIVVYSSLYVIVWTICFVHLFFKDVGLESVLFLRSIRDKVVICIYDIYQSGYAIIETNNINPYYSTKARRVERSSENGDRTTVLLSFEY